MDTKKIEYYQVVSLYDMTYYAIAPQAIVKLISYTGTDAFSMLLIPRNGEYEREKARAMRGLLITRQEFAEIFRLTYQKIIEPLRTKKTEK